MEKTHQLSPRHHVSYPNKALRVASSSILMSSTQKGIAKCPQIRKFLDTNPNQGIVLPNVTNGCLTLSPAIMVTILYTSTSGSSNNPCMAVIMVIVIVIILNFAAVNAALAYLLWGSDGCRNRAVLPSVLGWGLLNSTEAPRSSQK